MSLLSEREKETVRTILLGKHNNKKNNDESDHNDDNENGSDDDALAIKSLVSELSLEDQEICACASYAYFLSTIHFDILSHGLTKNDEQQKELEQQQRSDVRFRFAMREVRRHYVGENRVIDKTRMAVNDAIYLRRKYRMDLIRRIHEVTVDFDDDDDEDNASFSPSASLLSHYDRRELVRCKQMIREEFQRQITVSFAVDRNQRAVIIRFPRQDPTVDLESFIVAGLYIAERGIAVTELKSMGTQEQISVLAEFNNYASSNAPPLTILQESSKYMQRLYPERLKRFVMTDPPMWMRLLFTLLYPFLSAKTTAKVAVTSGLKERQKLLDEMMDTTATTTAATQSNNPLLSLVTNPSNNDQSMTIVDVEEYLNQAPHSIYQPKSSSDS